MFVAIAVACCAAVGLTTMALMNAGPRPVPTREFTDIAIPADVKLVVPDFTLVRADGQPIDAAVLDGRYTVLDFFFTNCPFACPGMTAAMREVQARTDPSVALLSVSVDGEHDTPEVLAAYAATHQADPARWTFATGDPSEVARIVTEHLQMSLASDPARTIGLADGGTMANIEHPTRLLLVDPDRRVIATASYTSEHAVDRLIEMVNGLAMGGDRRGKP